MSPLETRAWLQLWAMCPPYLIYFVIQIAEPPWLSTWQAHLICFAATSGVHIAVYVTGLVLLRRRERGESLLADERDRAIEAHATRIAYSLLLIGMVLVGVVMPFGQSGWKVANSGLLTIVLAEALRNTLVVRGYRGTPRLAH